MSTKRTLLKVGGILIALIVALVAGFLTMVKVTLPNTAGTMSEGSCADVASAPHANSSGDTQVLVTYASKYSSTASVAQAVMESLCLQGFQVDLKWVENAGAVDVYDAVIVGSPIYWGSWLPAATDFLAAHEQALADKTLAYFVLANVVRDGRDTPENRQTVRDTFIQPVIEEFPALSPLDNFGIFGGRLDRSRLAKFEAFMMDMARFEDNDSRDFDKVARWSEEIGAGINAAAAAAD